MNKEKIKIPILIISFLLVLAMVSFAADPYPGYNVIACGSTVNIYDMDGNIEHSWSTSKDVQTCPYLLPDGSLLAPVGSKGGPGDSRETSGGHPHGTIEKYDWEGNLTWQYTITDGAYDIEPLPNGNVMSIVHTSSWGSDEPGKLVEIEPSGATGGTVVWECNVTALMETKGLTGGYLNSLSFDPKTNLIAVTVEVAQRTVAVIDYTTKSLVGIHTISGGRLHGIQWNMSNYPGTDIETVDDEVDTASMRLGNMVCVCNDGYVLELEIDGDTLIPYDTWAYNFELHQGGAQRLPNGNTLVSTGKDSDKMTELDEDGNSVWSINVASSNTYRNYRYGMNYPGLYNLTGVNVAEMKNIKGRSYSILKSDYNEDIKLSVKNYSKKATLNLYNAKGKLLKSIKSDNSNFELSRNDLAKGLYFINVNIGSETLYSRIIL